MQAPDAPRYQCGEDEAVLLPQERDELQRLRAVDDNNNNNSTLDSFQWPPSRSASNSAPASPAAVCEANEEPARTPIVDDERSRAFSQRVNDFNDTVDVEDTQQQRNIVGGETTVALLLAEHFVSSPKRRNSSNNKHEVNDPLRVSSSGGLLDVPLQLPRNHHRTQSDDNSWIERMLHDNDQSIARVGGVAVAGGQQHDATTTPSWASSEAGVSPQQRHLLSTLSFRPTGQSHQGQHTETSSSSFLVDASAVYDVVEEVVVAEEDENGALLPRLVVTNNDDSPSGDDDDNGPMHERPMSILLRRKSAPLPRSEDHHTPDPHLDVAEHPESFSSSVSASPIASASNSPEGGGARRDRRGDHNATYFPTSPDVAKEYPAALMLWRRRASDMNLLAPATNHKDAAPQNVGTTPQPSDDRRARQSPPRRDGATPNHFRERALHHSGPSVHGQSGAAHSQRRNEESLYDDHDGYTFMNRHSNVEADTSQSSSSLLSSHVVADMLDQWIGHDNLAYHPHRFSMSPKPQIPPLQHSGRAPSPHHRAPPPRSDAALLHEHKRIMDDLREVGGTKYHLGATFKLDQKLQTCRTEGQHHRGKLAAMNYATEARLAAVRRVTLEIEATKLQSRESASRADIFAEWSSKLELIHSDVVLAWRLRRQADIFMKEASSRRTVSNEMDDALGNLHARYLHRAEVAETCAQLRIALETVQRTWEPAARHEIISLEGASRDKLARIALGEHFVVLQVELLNAEHGVRNMMDLFRDDEIHHIFMDEVASYQVAKEREARRLAREVLQERTLHLTRLEQEARLQLERDERQGYRHCCAWLDKTVQFMRDRRLIDDEAGSARVNVEENESSMWQSLIVADFFRGRQTMQQRELLRICSEQRGAYTRQEDELRHELIVAERKGKWEAEDAYRRRIEMEMSTMRHGHRQALNAFESHAATLVDIVRVEETDERDNILELFEAQLAELHERERCDSIKRFLEHQADQRDALAEMESQFRLDVNDAENHTRHSNLQKQYRNELSISRLFETERTMRQAIVDQERASFAMNITSELEVSTLAALERQRLREAREADAAKMAALRVKATNSAPFLGFSLAEKIASSSADKRLVNAAGIATLVVDSLVIGGPAFTAGLRLHDRIVTVKGLQPTSLVAVRQAIAKGAAPGELFEVVVRRQKRRSTTTVCSSSGADVELDEDGLTARSLAGEVDFGNYIDDDILSETSSSSQQNSPGRTGSGNGSLSTPLERSETLTFHVAVKTVNVEFVQLHDLYFDLTDTQRIERNAPTPGYVTRSKKNFAEKLSSGRTSTEQPPHGSSSLTSASGGARPRAATISARMSSPANGSFVSPLLRPTAGTVITAPPLHSSSVSPAEGCSPSPDLVRHATSLPRPDA
jgi:hypothetical protein